jgi:hypothetical protein
MENKEFKEIETYINRNGFPIIRRCKNCLYWNDETEFNDKHKVGYCKLAPMFFAFTLEPSVFPLTKEFYVCVKHKFEEESRLSEVCDKVKLTDILKKKEEL